MRPGAKHMLRSQYSLNQYPLNFDPLPGYIRELLGAAHRGATSLRTDLQEPDGSQAVCPPAGFRVPRGTADRVAHRTGGGHPGGPFIPRLQSGAFWPLFCN